ncbi:transposase [Salegentibacter sp. 24]|jgi:transposase|uniref:IS1634 family transposase n=1 Tax=Salegentibacter sp. 24 TaxID=2183986 RepID=UPI00105D48FE|nr:IS1634 family transposase [Salegentibacter sp. 24]TDN78143.1 transposase [Salegentibacter sp. 24]
MFLRKKKNRSGTTSVVVVEKRLGKFKHVKTIGVSSDKEELKRLHAKGRDWILKHSGMADIFNDYQREEEEKLVTDQLLSNIENILLNGSQLILNRVYDLIGFNEIEDDVLRHLITARLSQPMSKAATVEYLKSHFDQDLKLHNIYRYLDKLYKNQQEKVQEISVAHTRKILGGTIGLMFYDVTTLYFEADRGDGFRESGFSKDGKHSQPQLVLGLLVSKDGYPLSYSLFNGSQYEGRTMLPVVEDFVRRFNLDDFVLVADSGLMSRKNLELLEAQGYRYIVGARIKNESKSIKQWILSQTKKEGVFHVKQKEKSRLIVGYSSKRARKDKYNREKGVERLEKAYKGGTITKENINKRGYNKFLELSSNVGVVISPEKIKEDEKWDGLKGYLTNTELSAQEVYYQYSSLWSIERAFRITKGTIEVRPMFHFTERRIEAHVCICFVAYKVYKELERILKINQVDLSVDKVLSIAKTITTIKINLPISGKTVHKTMFLTESHKEIAFLFDDDFWENHLG